MWGSLEPGSPQPFTHIVHPVITNHTEATVSGCMHAYQTSFMQNVSSSYFDAASLTGALLAASFLGACDEQLQLASSGNQFSKIGHIKTFSALACFMLMTVLSIKTVLSVSVAAFSADQALLT